MLYIVDSCTALYATVAWRATNYNSVKKVISFWNYFICETILDHFSCYFSWKKPIHKSILMGNLGWFIVFICFLVEINCGKCLLELTLMQLLEKKSLSNQKSFSARNKICLQCIYHQGKKIYLCTLKTMKLRNNRYCSHFENHRLKLLKLE